MISRRTCILAATAGALALSTVEGFAPQPNVKSVTKLNNDIAPTGEFISRGWCSSHLIRESGSRFKVGLVQLNGIARVGFCTILIRRRSSGKKYSHDGMCFVLYQCLVQLGAMD